MIFSIDFDGTLCENDYPNIGLPKMDMINKCIELQSKGNFIILNTCRTDDDLKAAVAWCKSYGLEFNKVNENSPELINRYSDCRKISANYYVDDKNMSIEEFLNFEE